VARVSSAQRRVELVRAALRVIERDGVHGATTRAIVAEAGMPLASFHYAFRSRDEMIRELIAFVVEQEGLAAEGSLREGSDIRSTVRAGLQAYFDLVVADPNREQAMFELFHYALRTPELADLPRLQYESYHRTAAAVLDAGAAQAGTAWSIPVDELARLLVTLTDGLTLAWLADRDLAAAARTMDFAADTISAFAQPNQPKEHTQ
jgi:DNA-binding transcriptional regulator YbjK